MSKGLPELTIPGIPFLDDSFISVSHLASCIRINETPEYYLVICMQLLNIRDFVRMALRLE